MVFGIFKSSKEKRSTASNIEDADVLYFGESDTNTRRSTITALEDQDLDTRVIENKDLEIKEEEFEVEVDKKEELSLDSLEEEIEEEYLKYKNSSTEITENEETLKIQGKGIKAEIEGTNVFDLEEEKQVIWRPKRFLNNYEDIDDVLDYGLLKEKADKLNFTYEPLNTPIINDKIQTKEILERNGLPTPKTYDSVEDVNENHVVAKDLDGSQGDGFEVIAEDEEINQLEEDRIYEEFIDHYNSDSVDRRMFIVGERIVSMGDRKTSSDKVEAKNINNGGFYQKPEDVSLEEIEVGKEITDIFGEGIYALDYIRHDDGSLDILELNDTPGTKLNDKLDYGEDIFEEIAEYIENPEDYNKKSVLAEELENDLTEEFNYSESYERDFNPEINSTPDKSNNNSVVSV